jgi:ribose 5-phosphate isomerase B
MRIAIGADHNGVTAKARLSEWLVSRGFNVDDRGSHGGEVIDYPPLCADVSRRVAAGEADYGVIIGGSGQGEVIACNKIRGIRAGVCLTPFMAEISRGNNNANVLVLGAKVTSVEEMETILELWLTLPFKGGEHQRRIDMITELEQP